MCVLLYLSGAADRPSLEIELFGYDVMSALRRESKACTSVVSTPVRLNLGDILTSYIPPSHRIACPIKDSVMMDEGDEIAKVRFAPI
jgi:hypothetical protein